LVSHYDIKIIFTEILYYTRPALGPT